VVLTTFKNSVSRPEYRNQAKVSSHVATPGEISFLLSEEFVLYELHENQFSGYFGLNFTLSDLVDLLMAGVTLVTVAQYLFIYTPPIYNRFCCLYNTASINFQ